MVNDAELAVRVLSEARQIENSLCGQQGNASPVPGGGIGQQVNPSSLFNPFFSFGVLLWNAV